MGRRHLAELVDWRGPFEVARPEVNREIGQRDVALVYALFESHIAGR
jgi:hypothetical protein